MRIREFIAEQPQVLENVFADVPAQLARLPRLAVEQPLWLVGSGTSLNALAATEALFAHAVRGAVRLRGPLAYLAELAAAPAPAGAALFLSQTGTSTTTVEAVARARRLGLRTITVTADPTSPIGPVSAELLRMPIGPEPVGPKTKGFTASVLTLALLADWIAGRTAAPAPLSAGLHPLLAAAGSAAARLAEEYADVQFIMVLGQGRHFATALEASLKLSEMAGVAAAAFDTEEAFHGRFHGLDERSAALFLAADATEQELATVGATALTGLGIRSRIFNLSGSRPSGHDVSLLWPPWLRPGLDTIAAIVPFQLLACEMAERRGLPPERMRYPDMSRRLQIKLGRTG